MARQTTAWWQGRERWVGAVLGIALALVDISFAGRVGITFELAGRDIAFAVLCFLALSFALFGFLLGYLIETRRAARRSAETVHQQMSDLEDLRRRLAHSERLAVVGQLAAGVAHEIRNPLAILRSTAQNLEESLLEPLDNSTDRDSHRDTDHASECRFLIDEIDRLTAVTDSLLGLSRPIAATQSTLSVARILERVEQLAPPELHAKRIVLQRQVSPGLPPLVADESLVCQLLLDLLVNAVDATPEAGTITLEAAHTEQGGVALAVSDTGPGIPQEHREHIFDPLFTTRRDGHGLGLAIAQQLSSALGARLELDDSHRPGARFLVSLPAVDRAT